MKSIAILALLGVVSANKFLGDSAPVWDDSTLMKQAKEMSTSDDRFARFKAFEATRKAGKDDYTHNGPLEFVDRSEEENKKFAEKNHPKVTGPPPTVAPQSTASVQAPAAQPSAAASQVNPTAPQNL